MGRLYDDFSVGEKFKSMQHTITESEIRGFALEFDPQPFHTDPSAARRSIYQCLIASGFHTLSIAWNLFLRLGLIDGTSMGSPGLGYVKWLAPVKSNDILSVEIEIIGKKETSKPDRGVVILKHIMRNQSSQAVLEYESANLVARTH